MADLSALSTEDLLALKAGDLSKVSTAGLRSLKGEAPLQSAAQQVATDPITRGAKEAQSYSPAELLAGSAPGRFLLEPARGLLELGSHLGLPGGESAQQTGELIRRGREAYQNTGADIAGIAGGVASPAVLKVGKLAAGAKGLLAKMVGSGATGATAGAVTPTADKGNFPLEKAEQVGTGAALGAALPPAGALLKGLGGTIYKAFEPILPGGPEAILNRFQTGLLGPAKEKVVQALMAARQLVPGSAPTAGEAVSAIPEASALAAHQKAISTAPVVSGQFVRRAGEQEGARAAALTDLAESAPVPPMYARRVGEIDPEGAHFSTRGGTYFDPQKSTKSYDLGKIRIADLTNTKGPALRDALDSLKKQGHITSEEYKNHLENGLSYLEAESLPMKEALSKLGYGGYKVVEHGDFPGQASTVFAWDTKNITPWLPRAGRPTRNLTEAESARSTQAATDYETAFAEVVKRDKELGQLMKDPFVRAALPAARDLAKSKGITAKDDLTQFLHYVKVGLDKQLSRTGDTALASTEKQAVQDVKSRLTAWMDEKNPAYAVARENFAAASKPINQMQIGQGLQEKLAAPLGTTERAAAYRAAVRDPAALIKSEVGGPARKLEDILTPQQLQAINAVGSDLGRKAQFERLARGTNLGGAGMQPENILPNLLSRPAMIANYVARKLGHNLEDRVNTVAGRQYLNPQELAASLMDKPLSVRKRLIDELLARTGYPIVSGAPAAAVAQQY